MADTILIQISKEELKTLIQEAVKDVVRERPPVKTVQADPDPLLKISEVCKLLQVSKVTVHQWKKQGKIPFHRISNRIFFKKSEIMESLKTVNLART